MKKTVIWALLGAMLLSMTGCGEKKEGQTPVQSEQTEVKNTGADDTADGPASEDALLGKFETKDLNGNDINWEIFTEAPLTMLNIWGTFCSPCLREMPDLGEIAEEYEGKMQLIGLVSDVIEPESETAQLIVEKTGADYTHVINSRYLRSVYTSRVQSVPTTIFLNSKGEQVGELYVGDRSKQEWITIIEEMLEAVKDEQ